MSLWWSKRYDVIVLEYGIDSPWEMTKLLKIIKPHIGIMTKLDSVHTEQFGNPNALAKEEVKMVLNTTEVVYLNADEHYTAELLDMIKVDTFVYGNDAQYNGHTCDISLKDEKMTRDPAKHTAQTMVSLLYHGQTQDIHTNLVGKEQYCYLGVALSIADIVAQRLQQQRADAWQKKALTLDLVLQPGRMSFFAGVSESIILDSSYNASPKSVQKVIENALMFKKQLPHYHKLLLIIGDMRELGDREEREHRKIAAFLDIADHLILVGNAVRHTQDELIKIGYSPQKIYHTRSALDAASHAKKILHADKDNDEHYLVMVKGSQNTIFLEEAVAHLLRYPSQKTHLTRQSRERKNKKDKFFASLRREK